MTVYIGSDHRGFKLKQELEVWLKSKKHEIVDVGALVYDPTDDYPMVSERLGRAVSVSPERKGILLCGSGVGGSAAVNKIDGVRAAIGINAEQVRAGRHDDKMNILVIAADETSSTLAKQMVEAFLTTPYHKTQRYERRINQVKKLETR